MNRHNQGSIFKNLLVGPPNLENSCRDLGYFFFALNFWCLRHIWKAALFPCKLSSFCWCIRTIENDHSGRLVYHGLLTNPTIWCAPMGRMAEGPPWGPTSQHLVKCVVYSLPCMLVAPHVMTIPFPVLAGPNMDTNLQTRRRDARTNNPFRWNLQGR